MGKYKTLPSDLGFTENQQIEVADKLQSLMLKQKYYLDSEVSLSIISDKLGIPSRLVSNAVNLIHGKNFRRYLNDLRIEEAKSKLLQTDDTVLKIMHDVGFETKSNFNREFHRVTGLSPNLYRKNQVK